LNYVVQHNRKNLNASVSEYDQKSTYNFSCRHL